MNAWVDFVSNRAWGGHIAKESVVEGRRLISFIQLSVIGNECM